MKGIYKYSILKDLSLIIEFYRNEITRKGLIKLKQDIYNDKDYNPEFFNLMDIRLSTIKMDEKELFQSIDWINKNSKSSGKYPTIILTDSPEQVVKSMLVQNIDKVKKFQIMIFSTLEKSLMTFGIDLSNLETVTTEIEKLKV